MADAVIDSIRFLGEHSSVILPVALVLFAETAYYSLKTAQHRKQKEREELSTLLQSIPSEHQGSVDSMLDYLQRQPRDDVFYRIRDLRKEYHL
ncbi:hypothetical protein HYX14_05360 [Candidatus Woesearchaeota archaeon]|nr:hypothetical protein [Candidatus Woesearchaeota archaeon]